ncbi:MAG: ABC transporter ATP-binding protein [Streptococcaceae bacterium]|jgi:ABC-2 type transport system ATP-binding protein|nr:ABC transporter ATP-binding protein [Streptococcaceae bacterium]
MEILSLRHVGKKYDGTLILDDINFKMSKGEIVGLVGENGVGKTTLMKIILGLTSKDSGEIFFNGHTDYSFDGKIMETIGYLLDFNLYDYMTGYENLYIFDKYFAIPRKSNIELSTKIKHLLSFVGLKNDNKKVRSYSFGMKQRLGLALSLLRDPKLLILDEPFVGLDPIGVDRLIEFIKKISLEQKVAILISSHQLSEIEILSKRILHLSKTKLVEHKYEQETKIIKIKVNHLDKNLKQLISEFISMIKDHWLYITNMDDFNKVLKMLFDYHIQISDIHIEYKNIKNLFKHSED